MSFKDEILISRVENKTLIEISFRDRMKQIEKKGSLKILVLH
jgi:hypothetical protein